MCFRTRHQTNFNSNLSSFCWIFGHSPFNGNLSNKIQHVTLAKFFLCSFKFRQLVLLCQANQYENPARFFIGFLEFLQTFFAKAREFIEHILWEILKVILTFGFRACNLNLVINLKSLFCGEVVRSEMIETLHET